MALQWFWDWEMHWWCSLLCPPNLSINMENSLGMTHSGGESGLATCYRSAKLTCIFTRRDFIIFLCEFVSFFFAAPNLLLFF